MVYFMKKVTAGIKSGAETELATTGGFLVVPAACLPGFLGESVPRGDILRHACLFLKLGGKRFGFTGKFGGEVSATVGLVMRGSNFGSNLLVTMFVTLLYHLRSMIYDLDLLSNFSYKGSYKKGYKIF